MNATFPNLQSERPNWNEYFLGIAKAVATRADCTRRKVGAVLVDRQSRIIGTGYNGAGSGALGCLSDGECPRGSHSTTDVVPLGDYDRPGTSSFCIAIHAEVNALLYSMKDTTDCTMYITDKPCPGCRKSMYAAGIKEVWYYHGHMTREQLIDWKL